MEYRTAVAKWALYTLSAGLMLPLVRAMMNLIAVGSSEHTWIDETDFIGLGLIVSVTSLNSLEHASLDRPKKTVNIGMAICISLVLIALFACSCLTKIYDVFFDLWWLKGLTITAAAVSCGHGFVVTDRIARLDSKNAPEEEQ